LGGKKKRGRGGAMRGATTVEKAGVAGKQPRSEKRGGWRCVRGRGKEKNLADGLE